jgi:hypothetical protein
MTTIAQRMIATALGRGLLTGTFTYAGADYPCNHSPLIDTPVLAADGGGFKPQRLVTIIISTDAAAAGAFVVNKPATLTAADGRDYSLWITALEAAANPFFHQLTCRHGSE